MDASLLNTGEEDQGWENKGKITRAMETAAWNAQEKGWEKM